MSSEIKKYNDLISISTELRKRIIKTSYEAKIPHIGSCLSCIELLVFLYWKELNIDPDNSGHNESLVAKLKTDPWPLPLFFRVGTAVQIINTNFLKGNLALDTFIPSDDVEIINTGVEFTILERSNVQLGYRGLGNPSSEEGLTFGAGTMFYASGFDLRIDYSIRSFGLFGNISNLSLTFIF